MKKALLAAGLVAAMLSSPAGAGMVTARWGLKGPVQHPGTIQYDSGGGKTTLVLVDLSALPKRTKIHRARLFLAGVDWKEKGFDIVPARRRPAANPKTAKLEPAGKRLEAVGPRYRWLDATEAVRGWVKAGRKPHLLWMRGGRSFNRDATVLEIAFEGRPPDKLPRQVTGAGAFFRSGQVFITFKETDPPDNGKEKITWGELGKKMAGDYWGPLPDDKQGELRYRIYRHKKPITADTIGQADLLAEVPRGSGFNTRYSLMIRGRRQYMHGGLLGREVLASPKSWVAKAIAVRLAVQPGKPLPPGTGVHVHTVHRSGKFYYAVLTALDGVTNTTDISEANMVGPIRQGPKDWEPVLYKEFVTPVGKANYHQQWYSYWTVQPLSMWPARYDVVVGFCPELMAKPAALEIPRSGWNSWPRPPGARRTTKIVMVPTADQPVDFRTGLHDSIGTLKGFDEGTWKPFFSHRQVALVKWMCSRWPIDRSRISAGLGSWGLQEIRYGDLYALISGGGLPEITKGWQAWQRAWGIWGKPDMYRGRPDKENPYVVSNVTDWVLAHPEKRLPYVWTSAPGAHEDEMGWPPYPRFIWAMMKTKHPFLYDYSRQTPVAKAIRDGHIQLRLGRSLPAFAHCSLDDNLGEGDLGSGMTLCPAQVNGYLLWDPASLVDEPKRWEMTIWLDASAPLDDCTVELTPRYCQKFKAREGREFKWTNKLLPKAKEQEAKKQTKRQAREEAKEPVSAGRLVQSGTVTADQYGLVTIETLKITKGKHRIVIKPAR